MTETSVLALNSATSESGPPPSPAPDSAGENSKNGQTAAHGFWFDYINEEAAADFLDLTRRTLQGYRQRGGGPRYYSLSARCVRYRRVDLKTWADCRMRRSTSDPGEAASG